jgi:hypothetical protein
VPDAVPAVPPPSKTEVESDVSALEIPAPEDIPVIELSMLVRPEDVCATAPPMPEHGVLAVSPNGDVPDVAGLTPSDPSSVAPNGMPVGPTGEPGPIPSGDVKPSGDCAKAEPQLNRTTAVVAIAKRVIMGSTLFRLEFVERLPQRAFRRTIPTM